VQAPKAKTAAKPAAKAAAAAEEESSEEDSDEEEEKPAAKVTKHSPVSPSPSVSTAYIGLNEAHLAHC